MIALATLSGALVANCCHQDREGCSLSWYAMPAFPWAVEGARRRPPLPFFTPHSPWFHHSPVCASHFPARARSPSFIFFLFRQQHF
mmetsp:Transcript_7633/g.11033  ORF Transcript_7633/g.11033 Transcript_7633/m.11033 type:complete len:86 (+) Transcript_7633:447-704(+)|eukprot:scaffold105557_cov39-Tisochrysis_lutea.AAC.1